MSALNDVGEGEGLEQGRLLGFSAGFMSINLNGWFTRVGRSNQSGGEAGAGTGGGTQRFQALFSVVGRHKLSVVGVQEHHWNSIAQLTEAKQWLVRKGWSMLGSCSQGRGGVALLWKTTEWSEQFHHCLEPRIWFVSLRHLSGDVVNIMVAHFQVEPTLRRKQWEAVGQWCRDRGFSVDLSLADHNSVTHPGATSLWRENPSHAEAGAISVETSMQLESQLLDAWDLVHGEDLGCPGFTHTYSREGRTIKRRIDRVLVHQTLSLAVTSIFNVPVGFSDHLGVVCWLTGVTDLEPGGRWKLPLSTLCDHELMEKIGLELSQLTSKSFGGWEQGLQILRRHTRKAKIQKAQGNPLHSELVEVLRVARKDFVPRRGWDLLGRLGIPCDTMCKAYQALVKQMLICEGKKQSELVLEAMRDTIQTPISGRRAMQLRQKAIFRMMQELQGKRMLHAVQNRTGRMVSGSVKVAEVLKEFWSGISPAGLPGVGACMEWLRRLRLPGRWRTLLPALIRPRTPEVMLEALSRMDPGSAPGEDGIWSRCYQMFPEFFVCRMEEIFQDLEGGTKLPEEWTVACIRVIPKKQGAVKPEEQRPIALQQCKLKWLMTIILVQVEDALAQIVPAEQKAYIRGRCMEDHLVSVMATWHTKTPPGIGEAWVAIDYSKAYDSVNHALVEALLIFIGMPLFMIGICMSVMRGGIFFLVGRRIVKEVAFQPKSGIRQGDPLSPVIFVLVTGLLLFIRRRDDCRFWLYSDDTLVRVVGPVTELKARVGSMLEIVAEFGLYSGLRVNAPKSEILLRGVVTDEPRWHSFSLVSFFRYLGGFIGDISAERSFAPALSKVWSRCVWLMTAPLSQDEKRMLIHIWVMPCLRIPALLRPTPLVVRRRVAECIRIAMNSKPWRLSLDIMSQSQERGGLGLIKPDVFLDWMLARSFWRWVQNESFLSPIASMEFREWARKEGVCLDRKFLPLLVLARKPRADAPWLAQALSAWSRLMSLLPGVHVSHSDLLSLPLWHNKLFMSGGHTRAAKSLILRNVLRVADVGDGLQLPAGWNRHTWLPNQIFSDFQGFLDKILVASPATEGVMRAGPEFTEAMITSPFIVSLAVAQGTAQEMRQPPEVWKAFQRIRLPGPDRDFIRQALWKKLAVGGRMHNIFPSIPPWCPFDFSVEDHHHRLKTCAFLQQPFEIMRKCLPLVIRDGVCLEFGRLCWDHPELSLKIPQGLLAWKVIRTVWVYRCQVAFKSVGVHLRGFMSLLHEGLGWWEREQCIAVPSTWVACFRKGINDWLVGAPLVRAGWLTTTSLIPMRNKKPQARRPHDNDSQAIPVSNEPSHRIVYTDGSFAWEAPGVGFAGCGVCVEGDGSWNMALPLAGEKQTNNRAELVAVILALERLPQEWSLTICTDSQYVVRGVTEWLPRWKSKAWVTARGKVVDNSDLWENLCVALEARARPVSFQWVRGHVGVLGNEKADGLANQGRLNHPRRRGAQPQSARFMAWDAAISGGPRVEGVQLEASLV